MKKEVGINFRLLDFLAFQKKILATLNVTETWKAENIKNELIPARFSNLQTNLKSSFVSYDHDHHPRIPFFDPRVFMVSRSRHHFSPLNPIEAAFRLSRLDLLSFGREKRGFSVQPTMKKWESPLREFSSSKDHRKTERSQLAIWSNGFCTTMRWKRCRKTGKDQRVVRQL